MLTGAMRWAVRKLDGVIRRAHGVREFSTAPGGILRLADGKLKQGVTLADGTRIELPVSASASSTCGMSGFRRCLMKAPICVGQWPCGAP